MELFHLEKLICEFFMNILYTLFLILTAISKKNTCESRRRLLSSQVIPLKFQYLFRQPF